MSRIFTFVFILFATLSIVNAAPYHLDKRETKFSQCPTSRPGSAPIDVKISPDSVVPGGVVTFKITGTLIYDVNDVIPRVFLFITIYRYLRQILRRTLCCGYLFRN